MSLYNGYIRCLDNPHNDWLYTVGKVYKVELGRFRTDSGVFMPNCGRLGSFEDLAKVSLAKWEELELVKCDAYNVGDWVLVQNQRGDTWTTSGSMDCFMNRVCEITKRVSNLHNEYQLDHQLWVFPSKDFVGKLVPKKKTTQTSKEWTQNEIRKARNIVTEYMKMLASQRRTLVFQFVGQKTACAMVSVMADWNKLKKIRFEWASCKDDIFNEDIGMCVAACKVMNKPIPDFILNK